MCNLSKGVENRGIRKGIIQGREEGREEGIKVGRKKGREEEKLNSIRNVMDTLGLTMEQAMQALKIPKSEQEKYAHMLGLN